MSSEKMRSPQDTAASVFQSAWNAVAAETTRVAKSKGWWDTDNNDGEQIALMHAELSEALESLRHGNPPDKHLPEFKSIEVELADVAIRIMNYASMRGYRVAEAIEAKTAFNATRPHKHGGKAF